MTTPDPATPVAGTFASISLPASNAVNTLKYTWQTNLTTDGSVTLLSAVGPVTVATNATNITFSYSAGNLTVGWPTDHTGWRLQTQTNSRSVGLVPATNAWFNLGYETTNTAVIPVSPAQPTVFYRLTYP